MKATSDILSIKEAINQRFSLYILTTLIFPITQLNMICLREEEKKNQHQIVNY